MSRHRAGTPARSMVFSLLVNCAQMSDYEPVPNHLPQFRSLQPVQSIRGVGPDWLRPRSSKLKDLFVEAGADELATPRLFWTRQNEFLKRCLLRDW